GQARSAGSGGVVWFYRQAGGDVRSGGVLHGHAVTARMLGLVTMLVGKAVDGAEAAMARTGGAANADRKRIGLAVGGKVDIGHSPANALCRMVGRPAVELGEEHPDLLAAEPADKITGAHGVTDGGGNPLQGLVAHLMAEAVVDALE